MHLWEAHVHSSGSATVFLAVLTPLHSSQHLSLRCCESGARRRGEAQQQQRTQQRWSRRTSSRKRGSCSRRWRRATRSTSTSSCSPPKIGRASCRERVCQYV